MYEYGSLLVKNTMMKFDLEKWYKELFVSKIKVKDVAYALKVTSNKRENVYINHMGSEIFWRTKPYIYHEIEKTTITSSTEEENIQIENPTTTPVTDAVIKKSDS